MSESYILSEKEIKSLLSSIDREHHLQVYKTLKSIVLPPDIKPKDLEKFKKDVLSIFKRKNLPRLLTEEELDEIVEVIPHSPATLKEISDDNRRQIQKIIRRQLSKYKISIDENTVENIKKDILNKFYRSSSQAGDSVGVLASMSIGQPLTQANLNTFHNTGSKNGSGDALKFVEKLLNLSATKTGDITSNVVHFKDKNKTREEIYDIGKRLKGVTIKSLIKPDGIELMEKLPSEDKYWYANYIKIMKIDPSIIKDSVFLRVQIDPNNLYKYNLLIQDIIKVIKKTCKVAGFKQTIECIASNSYLGIIDIYTSEDFARKKIQDFTQKISSGSNLAVSDIGDQIRIFLKNILAKAFDNMYLKGIEGICNFYVSEPLDVISTFNEISIINARDLDKFSSPPYNLKLDDINYLWYIRITKYFIFFVGLNEEKYIKLLESAGMKIIENNFNDENPHFIVLLPKERKIKYIDDNSKKTYNRYELKDGRYYDNKLNKFTYHYSPKKLIEDQLGYIRDSMLIDIEKKLEDNTINDVSLDFEPLYRYAYYYHGIAEGEGDIISELYSIREIDFSFSFPESIHHVNKLFGIEAARFNLSSKYNSGKDMKNINPMNIELLIDFQTAYGYPVSVTANTLAKQGNSILTSASFQNSLEYIFKGSAFGEVDEIKGISSCIITGSKCRNGTGIVESEFSQDYLDDPENKMPDEYRDDYEIETSMVIGPCYNTAKLDNILDEINPDVPVSQEKLLDPPRMEVPGSLGGLFDLEEENFSQTNQEDDIDEANEMDDIFANLSIPDAPKEQFDLF